MTFIPYGRQEITEADVEAVAAALRSDLITQGPRVAELESALAAYLGASHAVALSSGTAALHAAAFAAGLGPGDEVITTPITFAASANCARYLGADVRFVDIDPATWNLDTAAAAASTGERTRAIVPVSYAGLPVDLAPLADVRERVTVIEDGCHAIGGHRDGLKVGGDGGADLTAFSFHPVKSMTTGEGGLVTTADADLAARVALFRTHGITRDGIERGPDDGAWYYEMQALGFNYRITDVQCALGLSQLKRARRLGGAAQRASPRSIASCSPASSASSCRPRRRRAGCTAITCSRSACATAPPRASAPSSRCRPPASACRSTTSRSIGCPTGATRWAAPQDACPNAEELYSGLISLPMFPGLADADVERVVEELDRALP